MSRVCSVSSQCRRGTTQLVLVPSVESSVIGHVVGWLGVRVVGGQVGQIGAVILEQAERLAGAGQAVPP